ncbi:MAG: sodium:alanine symporter family protein, partial [Acidobacteriota bacterium]|nr:sodium:alanine symporter family protein [Acidobacteriota bacterium]
VALLLGAGLYVTIRLAFVQIRGFRHAVDITRGVYDDPEDAGDLNHFQALTTALSATVGIGNIAGVAIAVRLGGPGALFWMWVTAVFGMALKYAECTLAVKYRTIHPDGSVSGGPMYYIERGLGKSWKWVAFLFACFATIASFGGGCMNQSNTLATRLQTQFGIPTIISGLIFAALVALVIIGGIRRIGRVTSILAPGMAILYVAGALVILAINAKAIPSAFGTIFREAFAPAPIWGGAAGSLLLTVMWGIRRGLFSNEAGQGSAPIAHATAKTDKPVREGLVGSLEPFIDTLVICTMTGLVIVTSGAYLDKVPQAQSFHSVSAVPAELFSDRELFEYNQRDGDPGEAEFQVVDGTPIGATFVYLNAVVQDPDVVDLEGHPWSGTVTIGADGSLEASDGSTPLVRGGGFLTGADLTAHGFSKGLGEWGNILVTLAVVLFAVSTGISWSYYGDRATEYVVGSWAIPIYRWIFVTFFFLGAILPLSAVWTFGDVALGLMSFPNLIALILLSGAVAGMTRAYFSTPQKPFK